MKSIEELIKDSNKIVFLTGAGISTASGISDFRSNNAGIVPSFETILSRHYFAVQGESFWEECNEIFNFADLKSKKPNKAHDFIARLERELGKKVTVITQNIDGLHSKAGSSQVLEIHGNLNTVSCLRCVESISFDETISQNIFKCHKCGYVFSPNFILYGDAINHINKAKKALWNADLLIVIGTSLKVAPANTFVDYFIQHNGLNTVLINNEETELKNSFKYILKGDIVNQIDKILI